ncbi:MAG: hypothetical protein WCK98_01240 [bacterium]
MNFNAIPDFFSSFSDKYIRYYDQAHLSKTVGELYILFLISVPLSLLLFMLFNGHRSKTLVDLGHHKWIIKN